MGAARKNGGLKSQLIRIHSISMCIIITVFDFLALKDSL